MVTQGFDGKFHKLPKEETLTQTLKDGGYKLVFEDDFDGEELDSTKWATNYAIGPLRRGGAYDVSNVFVQDSKLVIRTKYIENGPYGSCWYSGWVESATPGGGHCDKHSEKYEGISTKYGYFEARIKAPKAAGIWGAFWLMPDWAKEGAVGMTEDDIIGTGTDGVEIDVMESVYSGALLNKNSITQVIHGDAYGKDLKSDKARTYHVPKMYDTFHTYGVMWTDKEYVFYIDGRETYRTPYQFKGQKLGVSNVDEYMLLTVEIAGENRDGVIYPGKLFAGDKLVRHWAGNPEKNDKSKVYDFEVDWVRVYQKD